VIRIPKPNLPIQDVAQRQNSRKAANANLGRFGHELANQLQIINFCCCEIRRHFPGKLDAAVTAEFYRIEKTVEECVRILQQGELQNHPGAISPVPSRRKRSDQGAATNNGKVYPWFDVPDPRPPRE